MNILVTGGAGYIGSILTRCLLAKGHSVKVVDRFYFGDNVFLGLPNEQKPRLETVKVDVRRLRPSDFEGFDAVVDLAGISNDPSCDLNPQLTRHVNLEGGIHTARSAREAGVSRLIFCSSCSVYGESGDTELDESSPHRPVSLYARCKSELETHLAEMHQRGGGMELVRLRLATVFGYSPKMRFDLAVNLMTRDAYIGRRITIAGGGKQWRPFVHVADVSEAIATTLEAKKEVVDGQIFNVGKYDNNLRIQTLAYRVRDLIPGTEVVTLPDDPDKRSYRVHFDKLHETFPNLEFRDIEHGVDEIVEVLRRGVVDPDDRRWYTVSHYRFLADVEHAYDTLAIDGRVLG